ncbi:NAD(P)H-nitrite reductase large subunit [Chryseomicrobium aureum]|uniref:nitrite reductase n=1 Tax=Chryseomicrobium aureum TaxID=1441723 RepID=UPI0019589525|nr:nitrite reductase [Chryseomicrobium aureum]MBM7706434.1 NAD(P)H-nitrite reductase large subunit [Chryseomicrobium aureum]
MTVEKQRFAVNGGIGFGSKLTGKQLLVLTSFMDEKDELELTTFQQLYIDIPQAKVDAALTAFEDAGLSVYPVGNFVKSLRTCNFCKGSEQEGMPVAKEINNRIAGRPMPFTVRAAYTGCAVGCGEPRTNDIGVMKIKETYSLYAGGKAKGIDAQLGQILIEGASPDKLYMAIDRVLDLYAAQGKKREPLSKFVDRYGIEAMRNLVAH